LQPFEPEWEVFLAKQQTPVSAEDQRREAVGWLSMIAVMFLFPALFFLCVFFPIWIGLTPRW